jgi:DNA-binding Lrp family transcriptional regulator
VNDHGDIGEHSSEAIARERRLANLSLCFVVDAAASGMAGLETLDAILIMAVNQANIAPLTRDPDARIRYGALDAPAPDEERRPVSINAVAASLRLPYETVRRRLRKLDGTACLLSGDGAIVPEDFLSSPAYLNSVRVLHERIWSFYREVRAEGLMGELPPSRYSIETGIPVRGAARLISDYLLRATEVFVQRFDDLITALVAMALLCESTGVLPEPASVTFIARRLHLPMETVRRHVLKLVDEGWCERIGKGLVVSPQAQGQTAWTALFRDNAANVHRLFSGLAERGVVEAWERLRPTGDVASAAARPA